MLRAPAFLKLIELLSFTLKRHRLAASSWKGDTAQSSARTPELKNKKQKTTQLQTRLNIQHIYTHTKEISMLAFFGLEKRSSGGIL